MTLRGLLLVTFTLSLAVSVWACDPGQYHNGCRISGATCKCGYGCNTEYVYKTRRDCRNALKTELPTTLVTEAVDAGPAGGVERGPNACAGAPCARGVCAQTTSDAGFTCKCEGTGFYGRRCERACPTTPTRGTVFPHECVVI